MYACIFDHMTKLLTIVIEYFKNIYIYQYNHILYYQIV